MRIETYPLIAGAIVALLGALILFDAWTPDDLVVPRERRRRPRAERHRGGEAMIGLGVLAMAAALFGRDVWRYSVLTAIAGALLLVFGAWLNRPLLHDLYLNRGPLRRVADGERIPRAASLSDPDGSATAGTPATPGQTTPSPATPVPPAPPAPPAPRAPTSRPR